MQHFAEGETFSRPRATTLLSVVDKGYGTETVIERSNTTIDDFERQFLLLTMDPE